MSLSKNIKFVPVFVCIFLLQIVDDCQAYTKRNDETFSSTISLKKTKKDDKLSENDSDMLMESDDLTPITSLRSRVRQHHQTPTQRFRPVVYPQLLIARSDTTALTDSYSEAAQNFYPSFFREVPPLGHSRPYLSTPDTLSIPKYATSHTEVQSSPQRSFDATLLGSGDFGILRGGTFYPEDEMPYHPEDNSDFETFYSNANNGHGRPLTDEFIQKYTYPEEQFANFRDFADINTPSDSAFSQFVVVYAAKNLTKPSNHPKPKNIFEELELLDRQKTEEKEKLRTKKSKFKLAKTKSQKKYKKKNNSKDFEYETLLALS